MKKNLKKLGAVAIALTVSLNSLVFNVTESKAATAIQHVVTTEKYASKSAAETAYKADYKSWKDSKPVAGDYISGGYLSKEQATKAYETAHLEWEGSKPLVTSYPIGDYATVKEAVAQYVSDLLSYMASNPEPERGQWDKYASEAAATAAYNADKAAYDAYVAWENSIPGNYYDDVGDVYFFGGAYYLTYDEAVAAKNASGTPQPLLHNYYLKKNGQAATKVSDIETKYDTIADAGTAARNAAKPAEASNPDEKPTEYYTYYASQEDYDNKVYNAVHQAWEDGKPVFDGGNYNVGFSPAEAQSKYDAAKEAHEQSEPVIADYVKDNEWDAFDAAVSTWNGKEPQEDNYVKHYNHTSDTCVVDYKEATTSEYGYSGDVYCKECYKLVKKGVRIDKKKQDTKQEQDSKQEQTITKGQTVKDKNNNSYAVSNPTKKEVFYTVSSNQKSKTITIPSTVKIQGVTYKVVKVSDGAFKNSNATTIIVPSSVNAIGKEAFMNCKSLKVLNIKSTKLTAKTIGKDAFKGITKKTVVKVPKSKKKAYKSLFAKKGLSSKVVVK